MSYSSFTAEQIPFLPCLKKTTQKSSKRGKKIITFMLWELASRRQSWTYFSTTVMDLACTPQLSYSAWTWTVLEKHLARFHSCFLWRVDGGGEKKTHASETLHIYRITFSGGPNQLRRAYLTGLTGVRAGQPSLELHASPSLSTCLLPGTPPSSTPKDQASYQKDSFSPVLYGD